MNKLNLNIEYRHLTPKEQEKRQNIYNDYYKSKIIKEFSPTSFCLETWEHAQEKTGYVTIYELWDVLQMAYSMAAQLGREDEKPKSTH